MVERGGDKGILEAAGIDRAFGKPLRFLRADEAADAVAALQAGAAPSNGELTARAVVEAAKRRNGGGNGAAHAALAVEAHPASSTSAPASSAASLDLAAAIAAAVAPHVRPSLDEAAVRRIAEAVALEAVAAAAAPAVDVEELRASILQAVGGSIRAAVREALDARPPMRVEVRGAVRDLPAVRHEAVDRLIWLAANTTPRNFLLVGPAGTGKTRACEDLAAALGLRFAFVSCSAGLSEAALLGRVLPAEGGAWEYRPAAFVEVYRDGGVFLLDEVDAADANLLVVINAALANGHLATPGGVVDRHPDCIIVAAANTWGTGHDHVYVGRNQLDAATLDRFCGRTVEVDYSPALEAAIASGYGDAGRRALKWTWSTRALVRAAGMRRVVSTRALEAGCQAAHAEAEGGAGAGAWARFIAAFFGGWSVDERAKSGGPSSTSAAVDWSALAEAIKVAPWVRS